MYFCLLALPVIFSGCKKESTSLVGNWVKWGSFLGTGRFGATAFTIQNTGYVCTGYGTDDSTLNANSDLKSLFAYNPNGDYWTQEENLPGIGRHFAVSFAIGNKGYVGTGYNDTATTNYLKDFYEYDPQLNTWTKKQNFGGTARQLAVGFSLGNFGYVGTGDDGTILKDFWRYDPSSDTWTIIEAIGGSKRMGASVFVIGDTAYIIGGSNNAGMVPDFWKFDKTETFTRKRDIYNSSTLPGFEYNSNYNYNIERSRAVAFVIGSKGYVSCGLFNSSPISTTWEYDNTTDLWTQKTNFEIGARWGAVSFTLNNRAFVITGYSQFDDVNEFKPNDIYNAYD
jgi:N-acetylneuraminic acid mutarotase